MLMIGTLAPTGDALQDLINVCQVYAAKHDIVYNTTKTECREYHRQHTQVNSLKNSMARGFWGCRVWCSSSLAFARNRVNNLDVIRRHSRVSLRSRVEPLYELIIPLQAELGLWYGTLFQSGGWVCWFCTSGRSTGVHMSSTRSTDKLWLVGAPATQELPSSVLPNREEVLCVLQYPRKAKPA
ncbi:hypothetical protein GWK47_042046 [Chionoecetes opilio]|uniref:Uncharacterized protein n=1 Tax=Chionoecetes opilio TaxID=41210 RepID=A0A8J4YGE1_CHIOP|nr:hypothetical protein GWK47_042046 [Chionoecetes opilio]